MKKALIALLAGVSVAAAAAPALAQMYGAGPAPQQRENELRMRIDRGESDGRLGPDQAGGLRMELRQIVSLDRRYQYEGMADWQLRDLDSRLSLLDSRLDYDLGMADGY